VGMILLVVIELSILWFFFKFVFSDEPTTKQFDGNEWGLYAHHLQAIDSRVNLDSRRLASCDNGQLKQFTHELPRRMQNP
jgi:hypothetical protein